jgi:hypothetical protein
MERNKIELVGKIGKIIETKKRKTKGIFVPYCFVCYTKTNSSFKFNKTKTMRIRKGHYIIQFNGNRYYICKYCYSHKRKLKQFLLQFA